MGGGSWEDNAEQLGREMELLRSVGIDPNANNLPDDAREVGAGEEGETP